MKSTLIAFLVIIFFSRCHSDNFYDTERLIETDKDTYNVGDDIKLTLKIIPIEEKELRIYDNYKNLEVSFALMNHSLDVHNEKWSDHSGNSLAKTTTSNIIITPEKPFIKTFVGRLVDKGNNIEIDIPELKFKALYSKERLARDTLRIHGFCNPINPEVGASLEEYFEVKDIKINVN